MRVHLTFDVEPDCPPYLATYRGVAEGVPTILWLLAEHHVKATFFVTGEVARRFPDTVRRIVDEGHELGCHGDSHTRFSELVPYDARREIAAATASLRRFAEVRAFRAPNLDFPDSYLPFLRDAGYTLDSSQGLHKLRGWAQRAITDGVRRVPATISPSVLRLPEVLRDRALPLLGRAPVLFFHPWEFVDLRNAPIPFDCRFRTGETAVRSLGSLMRYYDALGADFLRMSDS
jgi:peptidoglycan/xylan/chitin deacetylase (PgdA/CDA1 family)